MTRGLGRECNHCWHAVCFKQSPHDRFPVLHASDLDDAMIDPKEFEEEEDDMRFKEGRDGDPFMTPFQCNVCHFVNIRGRYPSDSEPDKLLLLCIRRALLDSLWSRERNTVEKNLSELRLYSQISSMLGDDNPFPPQGPFPVADVDGMEVACNMLIRSLRPGRNAATVQYETIRKGRSAISNYIHASAHGTGKVSMSMGERGGTYVTASPTNTQWFRRFLIGCHRRMGDVWLPDRAMTWDEVLAAQALCEEDWQEHRDHPEYLLSVALAGVLFTSCIGAGLRGEEIPLIDIGGLRKHWHEGVEHRRKKHVPLVLKGRFKRMLGEKLYFQPLAVRSKSGLQYRLWLQRALALYERQGVSTGPLFRTVDKKGKVKRSSIGDLDTLLHDVLRRVQARHPEILPKTVNVKEESSVRRTLRRTFTGRAQCVRLLKEMIEANNRWRKRMHSKGMIPHMDMVERYSDAKATVEYLVGPSEEI